MPLVVTSAVADNGYLTSTRFDTYEAVIPTLVMVYGIQFPILAYAINVNETKQLAYFQIQPVASGGVWYRDIDNGIGKSSTGGMPFRSTSDSKVISGAANTPLNIFALFNIAYG